MTPQEIYDKVCTHLMTQRVVAGHHSDGCLYRDKETGNMCAVGCLIPDEAYSEKMENNAVDSLLALFSPLLPRWMEDNYELLAKLQCSHDVYLPHGVKACAEKLEHISQMFSLTVPEIVTKELK